MLDDKEVGPKLGNVMGLIRLHAFLVRRTPLPPYSSSYKLFGIVEIRIAGSIAIAFPRHLKADGTFVLLSFDDECRSGMFRVA